MYKYIRNNYHFHLLLIIFSFGFILFYGFRGIYPIDSFIIFNSGYNVLNGYHPFKDYWSISGPILDYFQAFFFLLFGSNWMGYVLHAFVINIIIVSISFYFFQKLKINNYYSFLYSLGVAILAYPQTGTPFMDHHAFYFSYLSIIFLSLGMLNNKKIFWCLVPIAFFISFFSKQLPSSYLLIFIILFLVFYLYRNKNKARNILKALLLGTFISLFIFFSWIFLAKIPFENILIQYFYYPMSIGEIRVAKINFDINSFVLQFKFIYLSLLVPLIFLLKNLKNKKKSSDFVISFSLLNLLLFISFIFSQIMTKNQILIFFLIPYFLAVSHYFITIYKGKSIYYFAILIIFAFTTFKYHDRFNHHKKFMELNDADFNNALDAKVLDIKLKGIQWITHRYMKNPKYELTQLKKSKSFIENSKFEYIIITDYQFFPMVLNLKTVSPSKWYDAMSVPSKKNIFHNEFKIFFKKNLKKQNIDHVYLLGKGKWPVEFLFQDKNCATFSKINEFLYLSNIKDCY